MQAQLVTGDRFSTIEAVSACRVAGSDEGFDEAQSKYKLFRRVAKSMRESAKAEHKSRMGSTIEVYRPVHSQPA
jgi:hypothetical protein